MAREGSGEAETGSKWSDGFSERFGMVFNPKIIEKQRKTMIFWFISSWTLLFPISYAWWVLFSCRRAHNVSSKENRRTQPKWLQFSKKPDWKRARKTCPKNVPGPTWAWAQGFPWGPGPRVPLGPGPKGSPGARAQGFPWGPGPRGNMFFRWGKQGGSAKLEICDFGWIFAESFTCDVPMQWN